MFLIIFVFYLKKYSMTDFFDLVQQRRSIRKFTEQPVEPEKVEKIMQAALMAPSGKRINPWKFILVTDKEMLLKLSDIRPHGSQLIAGAPLAVVVMADTTLTDVWIEDASIAASYIQLEAENLGLGSCWVQVRNRENADGRSADAHLHELLNIPEKYAVLNIVAIGHKTENKFPHDTAALQYDKISNEQYTMAEGESRSEEKQTATPIAQTAEDAPSHPHNGKILTGALLILFGLLFLLKRTHLLSPDVADIVFSLKSYLIYAGLTFIALHKFGKRNMRNGTLIAATGLFLYCIDFADWIWITFNIWNYWPLLLVITGALIVFFAIKNGKDK